MRRIVIVYDIVDNKRRRRLSDLLEGYGKRVNRSVFECLVDSPLKLERLKVAIRDEVDVKEDSVRIYTLCLGCIEKSLSLCNEPDPFESDVIYFF